MRHRSDAGFTLVEMIVTLGLIAVMAAIAIPSMKDVAERLKLGQAQREVEREMQTARLKAVTANRHMRVRFNCPATGQYRRVEVIGTAADDAANRCLETAYPILPPDNNPLTRPNHDGAVRYLPQKVSFGSAAALDFAPDGTVKYLDAGAWVDVPDPDGTAVTLTKSDSTDVVRITVNRLGKVQLVQQEY